MSAEAHFDHIYRTGSGHLRLPFANLAITLALNDVSPAPEERRAVGNIMQFITSIIILCRRMKAHLESYKPDSWIEVRFYEMFLDTQSLFLFVQQYLEDLGLIIRLSLSKNQRGQSTPKFNKLMKRIIEIVPAGDPFRDFLKQQQTWFEQIKDIRDDICHRTAYGKLRASIFPGLLDLLSAGGSKSEFLEQPDLRTFIGKLLEKILALSNLAEIFVSQNIFGRSGKEFHRRDSIIIATDNSDIAKVAAEYHSKGIDVLMSTGQESLDTLEYFIGHNARLTSR